MPRAIACSSPGSCGHGSLRSSSRSSDNHTRSARQVETTICHEGTKVCELCVPSLTDLLSGWRWLDVDHGIGDLRIPRHQSILDDVRQGMSFDERHRRRKPDVAIEEYLVG